MRRRDIRCHRDCWRLVALRWSGGVRASCASPRSILFCGRYPLGHFEIDGWEPRAFKRSYGIKYLDLAVAPDGRVGTYDSWSAREGNPVHLLSDDDQDRLDDIIEGIDA
jgi:hypothetical protein